MLINRSTRCRHFVFVHVPKTGGDSISEALRPYSAIDYSTGRKKHWSARTIRNSFFSEDSNHRWGDYFSFGVVRNPWEQVHSDYHFCRSHPVPAGDVGSWRNKVIRCKQISFAQFVVDVCGQHGRVGSGLFRSYLANRDGQQMVDFVMRHERLDADFSELCRCLKLPSLKLPRVNVTPARQHYRDDYDDRSRFLVGRKFADDIKRFNYTF